MKMRALVAASLLALCAPARADMGCGPTNPNCLVPTAPAGTSNNRAASTAFVQSTVSANSWSKPVQGTGANATASGFGPTYQAGYIVGTHTGTGGAPYFLISGNNSTNGSALLWQSLNVVAGASSGTFVTSQPYLNKGVTVSGGGAYMSVNPQVFITAGDGGTGPSPLGLAYGSNATVNIGDGTHTVSNWNSAFGGQYAVNVYSGSTVANKLVFAVALGANDAVNGSNHDAMFTMYAATGATAKPAAGIAFGWNGAGVWPFSTSSDLETTFAPASGARVANNGTNWSGVTFSGCAFKSAGYCIDPLGAFNDQSSVDQNLAKFYYPTYYTNPGQGIIHRMNRALIGDASTKTGGVGVGATPLPWVESYFPLLTVSSLATGAPNGQNAIGAYSRTSDYRAVFPVPSLGTQALTGVVNNDDTGACVLSGGITYCPTGVSVVGLAMRQTGVNSGLTQAAQFDITNYGSVVTTDPWIGVVGGTTFALNLTAGTGPNTAANISAFMFLGPGTPTTRQGERGIVVAANALNTALGSGGGGIAIDLSAGMSLRWSKAGGGGIGSPGVGLGELWMSTGGLLVSNAPFYDSNSISTAGTVTGTSFIVGANQIIGARITGWGAASNGSKAAFNGATATLAQTSAAVAQLIADLTTHGLIGP